MESNRDANPTPRSLFRTAAQSGCPCGIVHGPGYFRNEQIAGLGRTGVRFFPGFLFPHGVDQPTRLLEPFCILQSSRCWRHERSTSTGGYQEMKETDLTKRSAFSAFHPIHFFPCLPCRTAASASRDLPTELVQLNDKWKRPGHQQQPAPGQCFEIVSIGKKSSRCR